MQLLPEDIRTLSVFKTGSNRFRLFFRSVPYISSRSDDNEHKDASGEIKWVIIIVGSGLRILGFLLFENTLESILIFLCLERGGIKIVIGQRPKNYSSRCYLLSSFPQ